MSLGRYWETRLHLCQTAANLLEHIAFTPSVTSLRNAGVRCSSHLGGTNPFSRETQKHKAEVPSVGEPVWVWFGCFG